MTKVDKRWKGQALSNRAPLEGVLRKLKSRDLKTGKTTIIAIIPRCRPAHEVVSLRNFPCLQSDPPLKMLRDYFLRAPIRPSLSACQSGPRALEEGTK